MLRLAEDEREQGNEAAADNYMDMVMRLSAAYSIDLAVARAHQAKKERVEVPERRSFKVGQDRLKKQKNAHFVDLMLAICDANDVRCVISGSNMYVFGTGMPSDLDMCERYFALLAPQMISEADAGLKRGDNGEWVEDAVKTKRVEIPEDERDWGGRKPWVDHDGESAFYDLQGEEIRVVGGKPLRYREWYDANGYWRDGWVESRQPPKHRLVPVLDGDGNEVRERKWESREDGRVWRSNFYKAFVVRTTYRLREAKRQAMLDAGIDPGRPDDSRVLALRDKEKEVTDAYEEQERYVLFNADGSRKKGGYGGAKVNTYSHLGQTAGDAAGQRAVLGNEKDLP
jgi:hypothetical protein